MTSAAIPPRALRAAAMLAISFSLLVVVAVAVPGARAAASHSATIAKARARALATLTGRGEASSIAPERVCPPPRPGLPACMAEVLVNTRTGEPTPLLGAHVSPSRAQGAHAPELSVPQRSPSAPPGTFEGAGPTPVIGEPAYLWQAYDLGYLAQHAGAGNTVAVVDAFWDSHAEEDLKIYRREFGLSECNSANGCFTQTEQSGGKLGANCRWTARTRGAEAEDEEAECRNWGEETSLDLDAVSALCPNCHIVLVESNNDETLSWGEQKAYTLGASEVSDSWGGSEPDRIPREHPDAATVAASGDLGEWQAEARAYANLGTPSEAGLYPAGEAAVTAVGGTTLLGMEDLSGAAASARGFQESVWNDLAQEESEAQGASGGGCATAEAKPSWQTETLCAGHRAANDIAADADPDTGLYVYDSEVDKNGFIGAGGTSLATPLVATYYALVGDPAKGGASWDYSNARLLNDVTLGSNALSCSSLMCDAGPGYDGPTGNGTISGDTVAGAPGIAGPSQAVPAGSATEATYQTVAGPSSTGLSGGVYPNGLETTYWWEYGTTSASGARTAPVAIGNGSSGPLAPAAGSGGVVPVNNWIEGLQPGVQYHCRLVAQNADGTSDGYEYTFKTAPAETVLPSISSVSATPQETSATVTTTIAAGSATTEYRLEYGTSELYGSTIAGGSIPAGTTKTVSIAIPGLAPGTTYHFRIVAMLAGSGRVGTVSPDYTVTTSPAVIAPALVETPPPAVTTPAPTTTAPTTPAPITTAPTQTAPTETPGPTAHEPTMHEPAAHEKIKQTPHRPMAVAQIAKVKSGPHQSVTVKVSRPAGPGGRGVKLLVQIRHGRGLLATKSVKLRHGASRTLNISLRSLPGRARRVKVDVQVRRAGHSAVIAGRTVVVSRAAAGTA